MFEADVLREHWERVRRNREADVLEQRAAELLQNRERALELAIAASGPDASADKIVEDAKTFLAFLESAE